MVCVPCIVIPFVLWFFHKYLQPFILKFWNPWEKKSIATGDGPPKGVEPENTEYLYIQQKTKDHPVMVFGKTTCSYCKMAKKVLDETGVNYEFETIDNKDDCAALQDMFLKMTGERTVPRVYVGGKCIGGGTDVFTLHNQGKLVEMMKEAGATFKKED